MDKHAADLVLLAYRAVNDPSLWPKVMDLLGERFGGGVAVIEAHDERTKTCNVVTGSEAIGAGWLAAYESYYAPICPRLRLGKSMPADTILHDGHIGDDKVLDRDEYYSDFLAPQGYRYFIGGHLIHDTTQRVILSVQRPPAAGRIEADDVEDFRNIRHHLADAFALHQLLEGHKDRACALEDLIGHLDRGVVLLNAAGEVVFMNRAAEAMVTGPVGIVLRDRILTASDPRTTNALNGLIGRSIEGTEGTDSRGRRSIRIAENEGRELLARTVPVNRSGLSTIGRGSPVAAILLDRLPAAANLAAANLAARYDLTPTEAELTVAFAAGATLQDLAARRGVSINTVRTHFVRIRGKFGAQNLAELMRIVLTTLRSGYL